MRAAPSPATLSIAAPLGVIALFEPYVCVIAPFSTTVDPATENVSSRDIESQRRFRELTRACRRADRSAAMREQAPVRAVAVAEPGLSISEIAA